MTACSTEKNDCEQYGKCSIRDPLWQIRERIAGRVQALVGQHIGEHGDEAGRMLIGGRHPTRLRGRIGLVLQDPQSSVVLARVGDDVAFGPLNLQLSREEVLARSARPDRRALFRVMQDLVVEKRLEIAEVVDPAQQPNKDQIFFGATVVYSDKVGEEFRVTIVGVDEAEPLQGKISWISPVARALIKAREGDTVVLRTPAGKEELDILEVSYPEPAPAPDLDGDSPI